MATRYIDGIIAAHEQGMIEYHGPELAQTWGPDDAFSHLSEKEGWGGFSSSNTRSLEQIGRGIIEQLNTACPQILFLGSGAGKELTDTRHLSPNANITSASCTPVNPTFDLKEESGDIRRQAIMGFGKRELMQADSDGLRTPINPDFVLHVQKKLLTQFLVPNNRPIVDKQHIGLLENSIGSLAGNQDFIYDNFGGLYYTIKYSDIASTTARQIVNLLKPIGVLVMARTGPQEREVLENLKESEETIVHILEGKGSTIIAKPESFLAKRIDEMQLQTHNHVVTIDRDYYSILGDLQILGTY